MACTLSRNASGYFEHLYLTCNAENPYNNNHFQQEKIKSMKKIKFTLISIVFLASGLAFVKGEKSKASPETPTPKPLSAAEMRAALKEWEATPAGILYKKWESSPAGKKVYASEAKIQNSIREYTELEAVVTSLSLPPGSRLGFGMMVRMNGEEFILSFGPDLNKEFEQLHSLKVHDKIVLKSHSVMHAPKYAFPIVMGDYVEHERKIIYRRTPRKGGC
jgi:hypothetical protein